MDFNKNREKAVNERKAGADAVLERVLDEARIDKDKLAWVDNLKKDEPTYRLRVSAGNDQRDFHFTGEGLSDYPKGAPAVDSTIDAIIRWIEVRRPR